MNSRAPRILLSILLHLVAATSEQSVGDFSFRHPVYPLTVSARSSWLSVVIYQGALCKWTKNGRPVLRMYNQPVIEHQRQINRLNAFLLLREVESANFSCTCLLQLRGSRIRFTAAFFAVRSIQGWWNVKSFLNDARVQSQYPLLENCMEHQVVFEALYHLYQERRQADLRRPRVCWHRTQPHNLIFRRIALKKNATRDVHVRCDFRGDPRPRVTFALNGHRLTPSKKFILALDKFIIRRAHLSDAGLVTCRAENIHGVEHMFVLLFLMNETSASMKQFSVEEKETLFTSNVSRSRLHLTCPAARGSAKLIVWAEVGPSSLHFLAVNVHRLDISRRLSDTFLCIVCFIDRCKVNRIFVSPGNLDPTGGNEELWPTPIILEDKLTEQNDPTRKKDQPGDMGQIIFWIVLGLYGFFFIIIVLRLSLVWAFRPLSVDVRHFRDEDAPASGRSSQAYGSYLSQGPRTSYGTLFGDYLPMRVETDNHDFSPYANQSEKLSRANFKIVRVLGEGCFGKVTLARVMFGTLSGQLVAVKELKDNSAGFSGVSSLAREIDVLRILGSNRHVLRLLGFFAVGREQHVMITEFCSKGSLRSFLSSLREDSYTEPVKASELKSFAFQIAKGMAFVASKQFVHCDLAARNILLTDSLICKVADFGLARRIGANTQHEIRTQNPLPVRWLAPEAMFSKIVTMTSDVWSYSILVWEIFSLGSTPYSNFRNQEIPQLIQDGYRLSRPALCPCRMWNIVEEAWSFESSNRPTFAEIVHRLGGTDID